MATPRQMFDHSLDAVKGWMPDNMACLDHSANLSDNVTIDPVYAGRVVHVNADGEYEMGVVGTQMGIFLRQNSDDSDVANDGGDAWTGVIPRDGPMSGLVATGGYEVATTEFDDAQDYAYNAPVRAVASNSNATTGGRLTSAGVVVGTNAFVGVVSKPPADNIHKVSVLQIWTVYAPTAAA